MRFKNFYRLAVAACLLAASVVTASAQVVTASGKVTLKQADGTTVPVKDAVVKFYRTDIKQEFNAKSDKGGRYVNAGIPLVGTFTIAVSAPGARPDFIPNVKISARSENDFVLVPGDGSALTHDQIKQAMAAPRAGNTGGGEMSAEDKKKLAEQQAEIARITEQNKKVEELNVKLPEILKSGNDAFTAKNYDAALGFYDQGIAADPEQAVFYRNKATVLRARGVERYNAAVKAKDTAAKEAAKEDFKAATEANEKAVSTYREFTSKRQVNAAATPGQPQQNDDLSNMEQRYESYRIALQTGTAVETETATKAIQEYINAETDPAKKTKAQASLGDALFQGGKIDESIAAYRQILTQNPDNLDAIYGLGLALASDPTGEKTAEGRDMLEQFAQKAPANDPRKQIAAEAVADLKEALKAKPADKTSTGTKRRKG
ncbi:MAG: tetratricopeptide repeat protein [Pyrinomonadaceae bacterium]|nr:tetratricopeptide repeat protein [Acidobacteriota bacterium]